MLPPDRTTAPGPAGGPSPPPAGPADLPSSPAAEDVRHLVGKITTTSAPVLARCCTPEAIRAARMRLNEALRVQEDQLRAEAANGCAHEPAKLKMLKYGTFCDKAKGGCGVKVR